jgi:hypothetical protein
MSILFVKRELKIKSGFEDFLKIFHIIQFI